MILLKTNKIKDFLRITGLNYVWLAGQLSISKSYLNHIIYNNCRIAPHIIEKLLLITHMTFEHLFYYDGKKDKREFFYGVFVVIGNRTLEWEEYRDFLKNTLT